MRFNLPCARVLVLGSVVQTSILFVGRKLRKEDRNKHVCCAAVDHHSSSVIQSYVHCLSIFLLKILFCFS